jgi:HNH endonuclease
LIPGEPLNVGRKTRTIPPAIRRALFARDKEGCRFPGCTNRHYVDGHHIKHWANGGETRLSNLVLLCRFHHRLVHEGGVEVQVLDDGALRFVVNGRSFESLVPARRAPESRQSSQDVTRGHWSQLAADLNASDITITPGTAVTRWRGERMDYGIAIDAMLYRTHRAGTPGGVSAETPNACA